MRSRVAPPMSDQERFFADQSLRRPPSCRRFETVVVLSRLLPTPTPFSLSQFFILFYSGILFSAVFVVLFSSLFVSSVSFLFFFFVLPIQNNLPILIFLLFSLSFLSFLIYLDFSFYVFSSLSLSPLTSLSVCARALC